MIDFVHIKEANAEDVTLLAGLNKQLIEDEGHRNTMDVAALAERMRGWLVSGEYRAHLFTFEKSVIGYSLCKDAGDHIYIRQLFIARERRRQGFGQAALSILAEDVWPGRRLRADVLTGNTAALAFWQKCGFAPYAQILER